MTDSRSIRKPPLVIDINIPLNTLAGAIYKDSRKIFIQFLKNKIYDRVIEDQSFQKLFNKFKEDLEKTNSRKVSIAIRKEFKKQLKEIVRRNYYILTQPIFGSNYQLADDKKTCLDVLTIRNEFINFICDSVLANDEEFKNILKLIKEDLVKTKIIKAIKLIKKNLVNTGDDLVKKDDNLEDQEKDDNNIIKYKELNEYIINSTMLKDIAKQIKEDLVNKDDILKVLEKIKPDDKLFFKKLSDTELKEYIEKLLVKTEDILKILEKIKKDNFSSFKNMSYTELKECIEKLIKEDLVKTADILFFNNISYTKLKEHIELVKVELDLGYWEVFKDDSQEKKDLQDQSSLSKAVINSICESIFKLNELKIEDELRIEGDKLIEEVVKPLIEVYSEREKTNTQKIYQGWIKNATKASKEKMDQDRIKETMNPDQVKEKTQDQEQNQDEKNKKNAAPSSPSPRRIRLPLTLMGSNSSLGSSQSDSPSPRFGNFINLGSNSPRNSPRSSHASTSTGRNSPRSSHASSTTTGSSQSSPRHTATTSTTTGKRTNYKGYKGTPLSLSLEKLQDRFSPNLKFRSSLSREEADRKKDSQERVNDIIGTLPCESQVFGENNVCFTAGKLVVQQMETKGYSNNKRLVSFFDNPNHPFVKTYGRLTRPLKEDFYKRDNLPHEAFNEGIDLQPCVIFTVMEYLPNSNLVDKIEMLHKQDPLPLEDIMDMAVNVGLQVASLIKALNENGIIWTDNKANNFLVTENGRIFIPDFKAFLHFLDIPIKYLPNKISKTYNFKTTYESNWNMQETSPTGNRILFEYKLPEGEVPDFQSASKAREHFRSGWEEVENNYRLGVLIYRIATKQVIFTKRMDDDDTFESEPFDFTHDIFTKTGERGRILKEIITGLCNLAPKNSAELSENINPITSPRIATRSSSANITTATLKKSTSSTSTTPTPTTSTSLTLTPSTATIQLSTESPTTTTTPPKPCMVAKENVDPKGGMELQTAIKRLNEIKNLKRKKRKVKKTVKKGSQKDNKQKSLEQRKKDPKEKRKDTKKKKSTGSTGFKITPTTLTSTLPMTTSSTNTTTTGSSLTIVSGMPQTATLFLPVTRTASSTKKTNDDELPTSATSPTLSKGKSKDTV